MPEPSPVLLPVNRLQRLRSLSHLLDNAIAVPGTRYRVGLDPILGLLPGAGDIIGTGFSAYIILEAALMGLPKVTLTRMAFNILLETVVGSVPFFGDIFDFAWKANVKNLELLESHVATPRSSKRGDWWFAVLLIIGLFAVVLGIAALTINLFGYLWSVIFR
ncbi:DUF4112 domain-containing protein [Merismopedia glauca]|uniref:DUF4112 domain-containing protein n=1 Tax=Merismopedia glauca CCAP 1448/3 TaxID=1296344 RepID=A0A2T1C351_9CYAN|nr:DUF4112 domain-containing protein [Merismopedia glauca]PSB02634.1 DUF4112 domain-containing protein [Merismopedia glauca CCAP 1448/3]